MGRVEAWNRRPWRRRQGLIINERDTPVEVRLPLMRELWAEDGDSLSSVRAGCMAFLCENFCAFSWRNFNGLIYQNVRAKGNWNIAGWSLLRSWRFMAYGRDDAIQARLNGRWSFPEMAKHGKLEIYIYFFWLSFAFGMLAIF